LKKISAVGDKTNPDSIKLDQDLRAKGIELLWNTDEPIKGAVALLFIGDNMDKRDWSEPEKILMEKWRSGNFRVLPALFPGGIKPAALNDIMPADFAKNPERALQDLIKAINHFMA
jgi:hypothetical protein